MYVHAVVIAACGNCVQCQDSTERDLKRRRKPLFIDVQIIDLYEVCIMLTIENLKAFGADTEDGVSRCMGNEEFYLKMVKMMLGDDYKGKLKAALDAKDLDAAFEVAHALKGVSGNLSLDPLTAPAVEITELLRARTEMDYTEIFVKLGEEWDKLAALNA